MNVWSKLLTALRGGAREVGESLVDGQALRILDQEIRDAEQELHRSREALASIMARQKLAEERTGKLQQQIGEYEQYALKALDADNAQLAREVAEKIARLETDLDGERRQAEEFGASAASLRGAIAQAESSIKQLKQQMESVKATDSVQKAQQAVAQRHGDAQSRLHSAVESLERIKQKQAERAALMDASAELAAEGNGDAALDRKLRAAGLAGSESNAEQVLARLQARQAD